MYDGTLSGESFGTQLKRWELEAGRVGQVVVLMREASKTAAGRKQTQTSRSSPSSRPIFLIGAQIQSACAPLQTWRPTMLQLR